MPEDERDPEELHLEREKAIRWTIMLIAGAVSAIILVCFYSVRPIVLYQILANPSVVEIAASSAVPDKPDPLDRLTVLAPEEDTWDDGIWSSVEPVEEYVQEVLEEKSIDLNTASLADLDRLPGIGPVLAERIIKYREANGKFTVPEELINVSGIGEKTFQKLAVYVYVS